MENSLIFFSHSMYKHVHVAYGKLRACLPNLWLLHLDTLIDFFEGTCVS